MVRIALVILSFTFLSAQVVAQACGFGGDENFQKTAKLLEQATTCNEASSTLKACAWGSSADNMFASIVVSQCEEDFRKSLTPLAERRYVQEMRLCAYEYAKQSGTMSISASALCKAYLAEDYASKPSRRTDQPLRASFDCALAKSGIEKAICSDEQLGQADILLSRVYKNALKQEGGKFSDVLRRDQRTWIRSLPIACRISLGGGPGSPDRLRKKFEVRFALIDVCGEGAMNEDLWTAESYLACLRDEKSLID